MDEELKESMANYLLDELEVTRVSSTHIWQGASRTGRKQFVDLNIKMKQLKEASCLEVVDFPRAEQDKFYKDVLDMVSAHLYSETKDKYDSVDLPMAQIDRSKLIPVLDLKTDNVILFNTFTKAISEISYRAWERKISKDEMSIIHNSMRDALLVYDPYQLETFVSISWEGMEVLKVNTYNPPKWRLQEPPEDIECPEAIEIVLDHLFPDPMCKEFVLNWMYTALIGRNETYLVLNGKKGVGKGIFETLLAALVGREHYTEAPASLLNTQFNAALDKKRLVVMDEFKVGKAEHTKLKRFINKFQNIEKKGVDADRATETYNSYVISNNDVTDMYIETDDRRFSVPDLTNDPLTDVLHMDDIESLTKELENDGDIIRDFGYFIYERGSSSRFHEFSTWKGPRFWDLAFNSLREWQKFIADKIFSTGEETYNLGTLSREFTKDANNKFARFPRNPKKIADFLNNYLHKGEFRLGVVEKEDGENVIVTDSKWVTPEEQGYEESYL